MKTTILFLTAGTMAFLLAAWQAGILTVTAVKSDAEIAAEAEKKVEPPKPRFPADLAPAARGLAAPQAAAFNAKASTHKITILDTTGALHAWQEYLAEEWQAERVEETELVLVVGPQRKTFVDTVHFAQGPPVSRYKHEVEASVVEAKTGKVLANRVFVNMPRAIKNVEAWELTALGRPVPFTTVFQWTVSRIRAGFPSEAGLPPIVVTED